MKKININFLNKSLFRKTTASFLLCILIFFVIPIGVNFALATNITNWIDVNLGKSPDEEDGLVDSDGDGFLEVSTPAKLAYFCQYNFFFKLINF